MTTSTGKYQIDMCHGPLLGKIVLVALPLMAANVIQMLFNAVDILVIGRYADKAAMAAVGSCAVLIATIQSLFIGLSIGANVIVARHIGARDGKETAHSVHTAIAIAFYGGLLLAVASAAVAKPVLVLMETPAEVLPKSTLYMRLYSLSIPFVLLFNFGNSIMSATGDTRRPLVCMSIAGAVKVGLNLLLVRSFALGVVGAALATLISNALSVFLILRALIGLRDSTRLCLKSVRFHASNFADILKIGIPAGIQSSLFGISNVIIQSSINSFGTDTIAGNAAAVSIESTVYVASSAFCYAVISFVGQNHGAKKYTRIAKSIRYCLLLSMAGTAVVGWTVYFSGPYVLPLYNSDEEVVRQGLIRLDYVVTTYFIAAAMDITGGALRGLGHSLTPMIVSVAGICVFRIFWVFCILPLRRSMGMLLVSYPISWILVLAVNGAILFFVCRKLFREAVHHPVGSD